MIAKNGPLAKLFLKILRRHQAINIIHIIITLHTVGCTSHHTCFEGKLSLYLNYFRVTAHLDSITKMGLFNRKKLVEAVDPSFISDEIDYISEQLSDEGVQLQLMAMTTFIAILFSLRMTSKNRAKGLGGEHVLSIHGELYCVECLILCESRSTDTLFTIMMNAIRPQ
jgi:hypothetical protein